jgi:NAD(P)H dehydrogenase (quinone)
MPKDVIAQQKKVEAADALALIAPVHFCSFRSVLKEWIDRHLAHAYELGKTFATTPAVSAATDS